MHDWTLVSILFDWKSARVTLSLRKAGPELVSIIAEDVIELHVPQLREWGPSVSIDKVKNPIEMKGRRKLEIEMQSGDVITIVASSFIFPLITEGTELT